MRGNAKSYVAVAVFLSIGACGSGRDQVHQLDRGDGAANLYRDRGVALATSDPDKAAAYPAEAYRLNALDHVVQFWLPAVFDSITPTRTISDHGWCAIAASTSGDLIASVDDGGTIRIRDLLAERVTVSGSSIGREARVAMNRSPSRLVLGNGASLEVWDLDGHRLQGPLALPASPRSVSVSRDGSRFAVQGLGWAGIWAVGADEPGLRFGPGPPDLRLQMSSNGKLAAVMSSAGTTVYDIGHSSARYSVDADGATTRSLRFYPLENVAVTADSFGIARLLNLSSGETLKAFGQIGTGLNDAVLSEGRNWLATTDKEGIVRVWDVQSGKNLGELVSSRMAAVLAPSFVGGHLFTAWDAVDTDENHKAVLWDFLAGRELASWDAPGWLSATLAGQRVLNIGGCKAEVWDLIPTRLRYTAQVEHHGKHVEYDASRGWVTVGDDDWVEVVKVGDRATGVPLRISHASALFSGPSREASHFSVAPFAIQTWRIGSQTSPQCRELSARNEASCPSGRVVSPDERTHLTCGEVPRLWDVETGAFLGELSQTEPLSAAAFSEGGEYLATVTVSGVVQIWTVALETRSVHEVLSHAARRSRWKVVGDRARLRQETENDDR